MRAFLLTLRVALAAAAFVATCGACHREVQKKLDLTEHHEEEHKAEVEKKAEVTKTVERDPVVTVKDMQIKVDAVPATPDHKGKPAKTINVHEEKTAGKVTSKTVAITAEAAKTDDKKTDDKKRVEVVRVDTEVGMSWFTKLLIASILLLAVGLTLKFKLWRLL